MAWPKRNTRRLHIADCEYLWHLSGNNICKENRITVGTETGKHFLFIDPYPHDFEITPSSISRAVKWAIENGWSPIDGPTRNMCLSENKFRWLPSGVKYGNQLDDADGNYSTDNKRANTDSGE
jgi:hypothetical protein